MTAMFNPLPATALLPLARICFGLDMGSLVFGVASGKGALGWYIFESNDELDIPEVFADLLKIIMIGLPMENVVFRRIENQTIRRWGMQHWVRAHRIRSRFTEPLNCQTIRLGQQQTRQGTHHERDGNVRPLCRNPL